MEPHCFSFFPPPLRMAFLTELTARVTLGRWLVQLTHSNATTTTVRLSFKSTHPDHPWFLLKGLFQKGISIIKRRKRTNLVVGCSCSSVGCACFWVFSWFVLLPGGSDLKYIVHMNPLFRFQSCHNFHIVIIIGLKYHFVFSF